MAARSGYRCETFTYRDKAIEVPVGRIETFQPEDHFSKRELRHLDRFSQLGIVAAREAVKQYGESIGGDRTGVIVATVNGPLESMESQYRNLNGGFLQVNPMAVQVAMRSSLTALLAAEFDVSGSALTITSECASGLSALILAREWLLSGKVDRVLVGGVDSSITATTVAFFSRMRALSRSTGVIASQPFGAERDGFVFSEGAAFCVLTRTKHHGSTCRLLGVAERCDLSGTVSTDQDGSGILPTLRAALGSAGLEPSSLASFSAHGTSTPANDVAEARAVEQLLGTELPVTSLKGSTGHMMAASGIFEALVAGHTSTVGRIPPTAGTSLLDPDVAINLVRGDSATEVASGPAMSASYGFGGFSAAVVLDSA